MGQEISMQANTPFTIAGRQVQMVRKIAEGGYSFVYLVEDVDRRGTYYALKRCVTGDAAQEDLVRKEIDVMTALCTPNNPYLVPFYGFLKRPPTERGGASEYCLLMEYCSKGSVIHEMQAVMDQRKRLHETKTFVIWDAALRGVRSLHEASPPVAHRDIKVENILLADDGKYKLCDFGSCVHEVVTVGNSSALHLEQERIQRHSTEMYRAPEMCDLYRARSNNWPIGEKVDIWALGCVLFMLTHFRHPFEDGGVLGILSGKLEIPVRSGYSKYANYLISRCFTMDPRQRPSAAELSEITQSWRVFLATKGQRHGSDVIAADVEALVPGVICAAASSSSNSNASFSANNNSNANAAAPKPAARPVPRPVAQPQQQQQQQAAGGADAAFDVEWSDDDNDTAAAAAAKPAQKTLAPPRSAASAAAAPSTPSQSFNAGAAGANASFGAGASFGSPTASMNLPGANSGRSRLRAQHQQQVLGTPSASFSQNNNNNHSGAAHGAFGGASAAVEPPALLPQPSAGGGSSVFDILHVDEFTRNTTTMHHSNNSGSGNGGNGAANGDDGWGAFYAAGFGDFASANANANNNNNGIGSSSATGAGAGTGAGGAGPPSGRSSPVPQPPSRTGSVQSQQAQTNSQQLRQPAQPQSQAPSQLVRASPAPSGSPAPSVALANNALASIGGSPFTAPRTLRRQESHNSAASVPHAASNVNSNVSEAGDLASPLPGDAGAAGITVSVSSGGAVSTAQSRMAARNRISASADPGVLSRAMQAHHNQQHQQQLQVPSAATGRAALAHSHSANFGSHSGHGHGNGAAALVTHSEPSTPNLIDILSAPSQAPPPQQQGVLDLSMFN